MNCKYESNESSLRWCERKNNMEESIVIKRRRKLTPLSIIRYFILDLRFKVN